MPTYSPLLLLRAEHAYFGEGSCPALRFVPLPKSQQWAEACGLHLVSSSLHSELRIALDTERAQALGQGLSEAGPAGVTLHFALQAVEPSVLRVSSAELQQPGQVAHLHSRNAEPEDRAQWRLHQDSHAGKADWVSTQSEEFQQLFGWGLAATAPFAWVSLQLGGQGASNLTPAMGAPARQYVARFAARSTHWKYFLVGTLGQRDLEVVDPSGKVQFESLGHETLSHGAQAVTFRSTQALPLRQRVAQRFSLRERGSAGRIVRRTLPAPSGQHLTLGTLRGTAIYVSEIYVNG